MIGARTVLRDGIHGIDVMVPSVVTSARNAWITFCRILIQFVTQKEALNKEDKEDEIVSEPVVPETQPPQSIAAGNCMCTQENLDKKVVLRCERRWELLPCNSGNRERRAFVVQRDSSTSAARRMLQRRRRIFSIVVVPSLNLEGDAQSR